MTIFNVWDLPTLFRDPCNATARISARQHAPSVHAQHPCCLQCLPYITTRMSCRHLAHSTYAACYFGPPYPQRLCHSLRSFGRRRQPITLCFILFVFLPNSIVCSTNQTFQFPWQYKCNMHCPTYRSNCSTRVVRWIKRCSLCYKVLL
jgi:hypothetical protein